MNQEEKDKTNYRFSGYQLPKIQLDSTGPAYYYVPIHPYYYSQPEYWEHEYFEGHPNGGFNKSSTTNTHGNSGKIYPFIPLDGKVDENT